MDIWMDTMKVIVRILTILPLLLGVGLFMGKRSIGELPVFDFLVVLVLGSVVGADIADPKINHLHTVTAIIIIALLQKFIVWLKLRNRKIGKILTFEPTIVVFQGQMVEENISRIHYSIDNITQMLREQNAFILQDVELAIIEPNGQLSVKFKKAKESVTREDIGVSYSGGGYDIPLILDGEIQSDLLERVGRDQEWVQNVLGNHKIADVFYGALTNAGDFYFSLKGKKVKGLPPIEH
ncbi:Uncharacterized membrane protein YcaP, DUF421 family [Halobacillus karajensis]|uniref:DUF421 domain-containing protein n=1 Tax=Halobacillus karajensis TaxID=195088 RepID=A0A059NX80_9BACI|nr:DUF421 domain-containing protein [Halobacillus karajensis]CDQ18605.1 hypothetical protein BN982_00880 [Halobacillus karajensis]CDQ23323.1 hypothetical protein BN983_01548 [Halobacillus karajensis]CDQ26805.1 hypothetical protein BN981_01028 [Halobacillus karajensis]SEH49280.1 Uncharacterized membrane protein YcaP, DUF421 family [Halobacillus karajensis]